MKTVPSAKLTLQLDSLKKWTVYTIRVLVTNDKGDGPFSEEKTVRTKEDGKTIENKVEQLKYNRKQKRKLREPRRTVRQ